jgi:phosphoribosylglycinamide formyltransferase-1
MESGATVELFDRTIDNPGFITPVLSPQAWQQHFAQPPMALGVLASGSGSNFEAIAQHIAEGKLNATLRLMIYNNPEAKAAERADRWQIPKKLLNHREFETREALDEAIVREFQEQGVEWVVMAGWMRIVTHVLIEAFPNHVLNIHPSLLPSFKGAKAIEQAIAAQVRVTGCTVHRVALEVDSGPILLQAAVPLLPDDTPDTLHRRIQLQEHQIYPPAIALASLLSIPTE